MWNELVWSVIVKFVLCVLEICLCVCVFGIDFLNMIYFLFFFFVWVIIVFKFFISILGVREKNVIVIIYIDLWLF